MSLEEQRKGQGIHKTSSPNGFRVFLCSSLSSGLFAFVFPFLGRILFLSEGLQGPLDHWEHLIFLSGGRNKAPVPPFWWLPPQTGQCLPFSPSSLLGPHCSLLILSLWSSLWVLPPFPPYFFGIHFSLYFYLCMLFSLHFKSVSHRAQQGLELRQRRCLEWDGPHIS